MSAENEFDGLDPNRRVGVEARKTFAVKLRDGFIEKYLSGGAILDIGYRGYETDVLPIVPQAIGVDLDYPGYDGVTLPFPDGSQDAVFSSHCLEHIDDCRLAIREWFRVLKTGGYLVLMVPHKYLYERRQKPPSRWNLDHRRFFTPATLLMRIEDALVPNTYRIRHLIDNDLGYAYSIPPDSHPGGCHEIELVLEKIDAPSWQLDTLELSERASTTEFSILSTREVTEKTKKAILYDGLNLSLAQGTGIATYTRILSNIAHNLGHDVGIVYETPFSVPKDATLQDILFFDQASGRHRPRKQSLAARIVNDLIDDVRGRFALKPTQISLGKTVVSGQFTEMLPSCDRAFAARDLFKLANKHFKNNGQLMKLSFDKRPDIFHCTYAIPLNVKGSCNIYTIHDLVPLRFPSATMDDKKDIYELLKVIAKEADHIVTVSDNSKKDIIEILKIPEHRVTNTYQSATFPEECVSRPQSIVASFLDRLYGLEMDSYFLFFGALEPKKNVVRLIDAYLSSGIEYPLVLVSGGGWQNGAELSRLNAHTARGADAHSNKRVVRRLDYVTTSNLANLIRGARAVVFPSLYEGFGLPVLEAMMLGTPALTSDSGALAEIAGDAAVLVDPYDIDDIARGLTLIANDSDLCGELSQRGLKRAEMFSMARYHKRVEALYASLS